MVRVDAAAGSKDDERQPEHRLPLAIIPSSCCARQTRARLTPKADNSADRDLERQVVVLVGEGAREILEIVPARRLGLGG